MKIANNVLSLPTSSTNNMKKIAAMLLAFSLRSAPSYAQDKTADSSLLLSNVTIKAFEQNRRLKEVTAAVNFVSQSQLERFSNSNILQKNSVPMLILEFLCLEKKFYLLFYIKEIHK